jgi:hypothetical protein
MTNKHFPPGWDEERVRRVLAHYETQTEEEAVAEDERAFEKGRTVIEVPVELPTLVLETSQESIQSWANRPYISDALREQLLKANVLLVPTEGFRERADLVFPQGTEELFQFLRESPRENITVDICIEDKDYKELMLHADLLIIIASFMATSIVAPVVVDLIAEYIKRRLGSRETETIVRSELSVYDEKTGRSVRLSFEGPASAYHDTMTTAIQKMNKPQSLPLTQPAKTKKISNTKCKKRRR